jgi:serine/threonine protein phosphatase 1
MIRSLLSRRAPANEVPDSGATVPAGVRVYAVGDSHGRLDLVQALHRRIRSDSSSAEAVERSVVVYLGDYVDRGPDSAGIIDCLLAGPLPGFESVYLKGNHEALFLAFLDDPTTGPLWLMNGGEATCFSYGVDLRAAPAGEDRFLWLQQALQAAVPPEHLRFLRALQLSHREGDYLFVHAGLRPGAELEQQDPEDLIWIRDPFLSSTADFGAVVVHGHTPTHRPVQRSNRIGIDTGACYGGELTALVLEGAERRFLYVS